MPQGTKHEQISRFLHSEIAAGRYPPGSRLPSESQLVTQFAVSRPTAARALRDLQELGLVERRAGSGTFVRAARQLPSEKLVGLLLPPATTTEVFEQICGELAGLARVHGYSVIGSPCSHARLERRVRADQGRELCDQFIKRGASGVLMAPGESDHEQSRCIAEDLRKAGIPVVLLDRDFVPFPARSDFDLVGIDNVAGGYLVADHLIRLGCRHIHFIARPNPPPTVDARIAGVREAMVRRLVDPEPRWVHLGEPADLRFMRGLMAGRQADALICADDPCAVAALRALDALGWSVPRDIRLAGFDDTRHAALAPVPLTTVHQPCRDLALVAFRLLLDRIADPMLPARGVALSPRLVVRESCGAYQPLEKA